MIMILFQSPARWNLHVVAALVGEWRVGGEGKEHSRKRRQ